MEQTNVNGKCFPVDLLSESGNAVASFLPEEEAERKKKQIAGIFAWLGMDVVASIEVHAGPSVSLYEVTLESGAYLRRLRGMEDDFMLGTSLKGLRIVIPMPSLKTGTIGIEIGNDHPCTVALRDILETSAFADSNMELPVAIGRTVAGEPLAADLAAMPHLLVGGATAQGKTVFLHSLIVSLLYAKRPQDYHRTVGWKNKVGSHEGWNVFIWYWTMLACEWRSEEEGTPYMDTIEDGDSGKVLIQLGNRKKDDDLLKKTLKRIGCSEKWKESNGYVILETASSVDSDVVAERVKYWMDKIAN